MIPYKVTHSVVWNFVTKERPKGLTKAPGTGDAEEKLQGKKHGILRAWRNRLVFCI